MRAIQISEFGGPEKLELVELPIPRPSADEVLIKVTCAGLNFADTHQRQNSYVAKAQLPLVPGVEVAGIRQDTGERVVALCRKGGYAEYATAAASLTFPIPDGVDDGEALAILLQGFTAHYIISRSGRVQSGESILIHAAAGGVGSLAVQLARPLGAGRVIASASSESKRELALQLGADAAIDSDPQGMTDRILEANQGKPVDIVLEMAGGEVFDASLSALAPFGRIVVYGIASEQQNVVKTGALLKNSWSVLGFWLGHCYDRPEIFQEILADLFQRLARKEIEVVIGGVYPLTEARQAQIDLAARKTVGKLLLDLTS